MQRKALLPKLVAEIVLQTAPGIFIAGFINMFNFVAPQKRHLAFVAKAM